MAEVDQGLVEARERAPEELRERPQIAVYAAAAGLATAVPVPFLDVALTGLARGAALRRVAARHGVRLAGEPREVLSRPLSAERRSALQAHLVRRAVAQLVAPLRIAARMEDALLTFVAALLLDHYLATSPRERGAPIGVEEARRIREAMERAALAGPFASLRDAPHGFWRTIVDGVRAAAKPDAEDRTPVERLVDAVLDAAADAPGEVADRMRRAFDAALAREGRR